MYGVSGATFRQGTVKCAIARQPLTPVVVADVERLSNQQTAKAAAVEEQLSFHGTTILEPHLGYEIVFRAPPHVDDPSLDPPHAAHLAVATQICRIQASIEMERIPQGGQHRRGCSPGTRESILCRGNRAQVVVTEVSGHLVAHPSQLEPELMEFDSLQIDSVDAERVQVSGSRA